MYYAQKNIKKSHKNHNFKVSAPTWNEKFDQPDGSNSLSAIQVHFEYILKRQREKADNPPIRIYVNTVESRIAFKIKTGYYLKILMPEIIKLLGSTKKKKEKKNIENMPHLEITEVVLVHCNIVNNDYQRDSRVLYTFVPSKSFCQLLGISTKNCIS